MSAGSFTITPSGPFSLAEAATFGFGQRDAADWDGVMRLAFCLDSYQEHVGVEVRQDDAGDVHATIHGPSKADIGAVRCQVARVLSLDHDGAEFMLVGERDPVIGKLQAAARGLRPPLFYSPYEAAAWSVLSARRPARQMMQVRHRLSQAHGAVFGLAGAQLAALPTPSQLLRVESFPGISADKMLRLHGVAQAALDGRLDVNLLKEKGPERAMAELQSNQGHRPVLQRTHRDPRHRLRRRACRQRAQGPGPDDSPIPPVRSPIRGRVPAACRRLEALQDVGRGPHPGRRAKNSGR